MDLLRLPSLSLYDDGEMHIIAEWHDNGTDHQAVFVRTEASDNDEVEEVAVFQQLRSGNDTYSVVGDATLDDVPGEIQWLIKAWACPPAPNSRNGGDEPNRGAFA